MQSPHSIPPANVNPLTDPGSRKVALRSRDFEAVIVAVRAELAEDHFSAGIGKFREAVNLSRGLPALEQTAISVAVDLATELFPRSSRIARSLLQEAEEVNSKKVIPEDLWRGIHEREREETISSALTVADAASSNGTNGTMTPVRQRLAVLAAQYPGEPRLQTRLKALEAVMALQLDGERLVQTVKKIKAAEASQLLARAAWARSREFQKDGFTEEAFEQLEKVRAIDPFFPGLKEAIAHCNRLRNSSATDSGSTEVVPSEMEDGAASEASTQARWMNLAEATRNRLKSAATLTFAAVAISVAGGLVWMNHAKSVSKPEIKAGVQNPPSASVARAEVKLVPTYRTETEPSSIASPQHQTAQNPMAKSQTAQNQTAQSLKVNGESSMITPLTLRKIDNDAWSAVNPHDADLVESYLSRFPSGAYRGQAVQALTDIRITRRESAEVLDAVRQYAAAWSARDADSILSLQQNLDRQTVEAQLSTVKALVMNVSPVSRPRIEGNLATIRCLRTMSEVFDDGVKRESPEQSVTFVLAKRDGTWIIQSPKQ